MAKDAFYITTPIYYVTDSPHIGHLYTTVAADVRARYERLMGHEVWFLTGTDEHGQKVARKAEEKGVTPKALVDEVHQRYIRAWKFFEIQYDDFIRTTEERHARTVQRYLAELMKKGDVYLSEYEGWYCVSDEAYLTESQIKDGKSIESGKPVEKIREESYFFKMSAYVDRLKKHIEANPEFIMPESRRNEVLGFLNGEVRDISISRTTIPWGIPMPESTTAKKKHTVYVWFDALTNYISALEPDRTPDKYKKFWPQAVHLIGKDILRFHAVYWPTFLMALGLPLPKQIVAHGWLTESNRKISKSSGNAVDPIQLAGEVGMEALRYFVMREFVFGQDGEYTHQSMYQRINSDLANDFGNCINRICSMIPKYLGDGPHEISIQSAVTGLQAKSVEALEGYHRAMEKFQFNRALESIWSLVTEVNRCIENNAPWALAKSDKAEDKEKLRDVLWECHEGLRLAATATLPFIPASSVKALGFLGAPAKVGASLAQLNWASGPKQLKVEKSTALFPRLEFKPA